MPVRPGNVALRMGRRSIAGHAYLVTTCTRDREPVFADHDNARAVSRIAHDPKTWDDAALMAWVLMPDHWHGLIVLGTTSLPALMSRFKATSARAVGAGSIWQRGFHDRAVRADQQLITLARYVVANPLRARLVRSVGDYPYWDAVWL